MKRLLIFFILVLTALLLSFVSCADKNPPIDEPSSSEEEGDNSQNGDSDDAGGEKNEVILPLSLTGADDKRSYLRLVYEDIGHTRLTNIFAHHITSDGRREVTEIFRSLDPGATDDIMILLRWFADADEGVADYPTLLLFREYNADRNDIPLANALYEEYEFYYEAMPVDAEGIPVHFVRLNSTGVSVQVNKPGYDESKVLEFLDEYESAYEKEIERDPRRYKYDLIYSCTRGEEKKMKMDLQQIIPFPWTRIKGALEK